MNIPEGKPEVEFIKRLTELQAHVTKLIFEAWEEKCETCEHKKIYVSEEFMESCGRLYDKQIMDDNYVPCCFVYCDLEIKVTG